jgi:hypothetical protein
MGFTAAPATARHLSTLGWQIARNPLLTRKNQLVKSWMLQCILGMVGAYGGCAQAGETFHLVPSAPIYQGYQPPFPEEVATGPIYQAIVEEKILNTSGEVARIFEYSSSLYYDLGMSLRRRIDGIYLLSIRQSKRSFWDPANIFANRKGINSGNKADEPFFKGEEFDLKGDIDSIKIEQCEFEVPALTAVAVHQLWMALLVRTRNPLKSPELAGDDFQVPDRPIFMHPTFTILSAQDETGTVRSGMIPLGSQDRIRIRLHKLINQLLSCCDKPAKKRARRLAAVEVEAKSLTKMVETKSK